MKNNIFKLLALLLPIVGLFSSCSKEEITFDNELPQFELKSDRVLFEVIVPSTTQSTDQIFISGDFNGGDSLAVLDSQWQLQRADSSKVTGTAAFKWGIYLDPSTFVNGKSLADGFHFISVDQGLERTVLNTDAVHTDNPSVGTRTNIWVSRWAKWFKPEDEPTEHDGYVVYVNDQTSWGGALALYMWGDINDLNGSWPGMQPTGTETINGTTYTYFDMGEANTGLAENLIFNNNGGGNQLADYAYTIDHDVYLKITDSGVEEEGPSIQHDGYVVYVDDQTGWDVLTLYMWGDVNDLNGSWPGMTATGTEVVDGVTYTYFDMGEANTGLVENLIFSNNGSNQLGDYKNYTIDHDVYLVATTSGVTEKGAEPEPEPEPTASHKIYVQDNTGWDALYLYAWGDGIAELFGGWPGATPTTETVDGVDYKVFEYSAEDGLEYHLIFNNNNGTQYDAPVITTGSDYYITAEASSASLKAKRRTAKRSRK